MKELVINGRRYAIYEIGSTPSGLTIWIKLDNMLFQNDQGKSENMCIALIQCIEETYFAAAAYLNVDKNIKL